MERKIAKELEAWRNKPRRKPLLLQGARQVGKTYSVLEFGRAHYRNTLYVSLEDSREYAAVFERDLDPDRIVRELAALMGQTVSVDGTLIVLDEVQAVPRALTSLKYFAEGSTPYHVIATGSLLGVNVAPKHQTYSFPVGKVDMRTMYPLDFEEFAWAVGEPMMADAIREYAGSNRAFLFHERALGLYRQHLAVGGMPEVVRTFAEQGLKPADDFNLVVAALKRLNDSAIADMAKYAAPADTARIIGTWASMPAQLGKDNHKFQYSLIRPGARASQYEWALWWLELSGLVIKVPLTSQGRLPLAAHVEADSFKLYLHDTGVLATKLEVPLHQLVHAPRAVSGFAGALTENYVAQTLAARGITAYYWASPGKAEVDFVIQNRDGDIVPIEVKAGDNVRSRSLARFAELYRPRELVRISTRNFGFEGAIRSVPLYAAWLI